MEIILAQNLSERVAAEALQGWFLPFRDLGRKDIFLIKKHGIQRLLLPALSQDQSEEFFGSFDAFWDEAIRGKGRHDPFWRTAVSSKMQPWDRSVGYFCLVLFTLSRIEIPGKLLILVDDLATRSALLEWARIKGWKMHPTICPEVPFMDPLKEELGNLFCFLLRSGQCLYKKFMAASIRYEAVLPEDGPRALIVSLMYPASLKDGKYRDPFFGDLHMWMKRQGFKTTYLCDVLNTSDREVYKRASRCTETEVLTLYSQLGWRDILSSLFQQLSRKIVFSACRFEGCDMSGLLSWKARSFGTSFDVHAKLFYVAVKNLSKKYKFERLILGFEGNVFERACVQAASEASIHPVIGYAHPVLYPQNLKIRMTAEERGVKPGPDRYICTGAYSKELLMRIGREYSNESVKEGCMIKNVSSSAAEGIHGGDCILVALDGVHNTFSVLDWVCSVAGNLKGYRFVVRCHPNISPDRTISQCIQNMPENVSLSNGNMQSDLDKSMCVLYRHSSVGIQAILCGIPAIHLNIDSPLCGDPLKELHSFKWSVNSEAELKAAIKEIEGLKPEEVRAQRFLAQDFLKSYFAETTEEALEVFID